jgi:glycosyltransferase involved in cell wall biosynthesis
MHPSAGGPPVVVENFVRETNALGHLSEIVSTPLFCDGDEPILLQRLNKLAPTAFLSRSRAFNPWHGETQRKLGERIRATDIVHLHTLWNPINVAVRRECARHERPYVLMPHGMLDPYSLSVRRWRKALYLWAIEGINISSARRIIYTTAEEARLAASEFNSLPRGCVIPLGGDAPRNNVEDLASRFLETFPKARGRRQLLFLGRLHSKKGIDRVLMALPLVVKEFPDVLLTIAGDGAPEFRETLIRLIAAQGMENNVLMTGRLDGSAKWGAYASAELFLLPSRQENFAITVAEAMQMGVPVIITEKVNTWPYVKEARAGLVLDERDINALLPHAIEKLLKDDAKRLEMGVQGSRYARERLTWQASARELLNCYDQILSGSSAQANCYGS